MEIRKRTCFAVGIFAAMTLCMFSAQVIYAADDGGIQQAGSEGSSGTTGGAHNFQISPLRYDWVVNPGDERSGMVFVKNNSDKSMTFDVDVQDFYIEDDLKTDAKFFIPKEGHPMKAYDVIEWIDVDKTPIVLQPGEGKKVPFSAKVPLESPTGGYYGVLFFTERPREQEGGAAAKVSIVYRLGALLTFGVRGSEKIDEQGELNLFEAEKSVFIDNPVPFKAHVKNTGNFPYKVSGTIDIERFGRKSKTLDVAGKLIYPDRTRVLEGLVWNFSLLDIGKYTAKMHLMSEDGVVVLDKETTFWVLPWKTIAAVCGALIVLSAIFFLGRVHGHKKAKKK